MVRLAVFQLGGLPSFGRSRDRRGKEAIMDLDSALGSLLDQDGSGSSRAVKSRAAARGSRQVDKQE